MYGISWKSYNNFSGWRQYMWDNQWQRRVTDGDAHTDVKTSWRSSECIPCTALDRPWGFQQVEDPRFQDNRHMKVVSLSALRTGRLYPPGNIPGTHFCYKLSRPQGHSAAGRNMWMRNSNDSIGNRTRDLVPCSAVSQPTVRPRAPNPIVYLYKLLT